MKNMNIKELSPETIQKLLALKNKPENNQKLWEFKFEPFCNLEEIKKEKSLKRKLEREKKKADPVKKKNTRTK